LYFFEVKFPEFLVNDLYITGESYAGIYVPYVVDQIHKHNKDPASTTILNMVGFVVGNGVTNYEFDNQAAYLEIVYWHGLISDKIHYALIDNNCYDEFKGDQPLSLICADLLV